MSSRRFLWVLCLFLLATFGMGCAPEDPKPAKKADSPIDKTVFALVPVRAAYVKPAEPMADEEARKIENALRMTYAPVECTGPNARLSMNLILGATRSSPDMVRRNGRRIVVIAGGVEPVTYDDCHVVGSHVVGGATLLKVFSRPAKSDEEFAFQQALWLAIREPWRLHAGVLSGDFYTFLAEHVGAVPNEDRTKASLNVISLDRTFNPCSSEVGTGRDKFHFFKCVGEASYANTRAFAKNRDKLLSFIAANETMYLKELAANPLADGPEVEGMTAALRATGSPYDIHVGNSPVAMPAAVAAPSAEVADTAASGLTKTNVLKLEGSTLQKALGLRAMRAPDDVISASNPRLTTTPPEMFPDTASPTAGAPDQNGWQKIGDTFFAVRGDSYVTAKAVPGVNGPVFRTGVWKVMGKNYWSGDLGRSTWQFSQVRKQFWRRAFNGNPFDFAAGELATTATADEAGTKVRSNPIGPAAPAVPKGWTKLPDGSLRDKSGQIWVWKPALGAYVKLHKPRGPPNAGSTGTGSGTIITGPYAGPQAPSCGCTSTTNGAGGTGSTGSTGGTGGTGTGGTGTGGTGTGGTGTGGTGTGGTGTGGTGTGGTGIGSTGGTGPDGTQATTGIDAFRSDFNNAHPDGVQLQGSAADQQALISTRGEVADYSDVARALPYGGNRVGPDGTAVGDTYSQGYVKNADGTTTVDGTRNICGDMSFNTAQGLNALGINSGQVAVQWQNAEGATDYHAVNYIQTGTNAAGDATFQFYDPQTGQATGTGYTNAAEGIQALGQQAGSSYSSTGDWSVSTSAGGIIGPGQTFSAPANAGGGQQDGSNSPNGTAGQWLNNYQSGQTPDARTGDEPTSQPGGNGDRDDSDTPTSQPGGGGGGNEQYPSQEPGGGGGTGGGDNYPAPSGNYPSSPSDNDDSGSDTSPPAPNYPPADTGSSFPDDNSGGYDPGGAGDYGSAGDYGDGADYGDAADYGGE